MFSEPGGPMFRRLPPPAPIRGLLPPPGPPFPGSLQPTSLPPGPHPADMAGESRCGPCLIYIHPPRFLKVNK